MAANVETLGGLERRLTISVPRAEIDSEVETRLKQLARNVRLSGFRPGKVPLKVVAQQYGDQVRREVLGDALQKNFSEAVQTQNLKVAGYPRFEPPRDEAGDAVQASATFEIYPDVRLGTLAQSGIQRPQVTVTDTEVDKTLDIMRKQRATYETVARAAQAGDQATIDFAGTIDGVPFDGGTATGQPIVLGEGRLLPDFEKHLLGAGAGDARAFDLKFPDDYGSQTVAGKNAHFEVKVNAVAQPKLPPVDADFARTLGVEDGDIAKMRAEVKANLEREVVGRVKQKVKEQVMQLLVDTTPVDVPKSLVELEADRMAQAMRQDLAARGVKIDSMPIPPDAFTAQAERRVRLGLILAELVRVNGLQAKPEQVKSAVEELAQSYEHPQEVVKWHYQSADRLREVEGGVVEENVVQWVLSAAKVEDKATPFDELMGRN
ncbi:MAG: trigger factor [Burkholderiales bacterium]